MLKTVIHLASLLCGTIIVLKFPGILGSVSFCARNVHILAPFQPLSPNMYRGILYTYFHGGQVEDSTLGQHLMRQVQYPSTTSFFHCSTSQTDRRAIRKTDIQPPSQLQGDSHCQGEMVNTIV